MNAVMKPLGFLLLLPSVVANAALVQDDLVIATVVDDTDGIYSRESRSSERLGIPWHLDRIDQRRSHLDGKYIPFANGTGVDIYILADGIDYENEEFGGRAVYARFMPHNVCTEYEVGNNLASLAAGKYAGVAKNANVFVVNLIKCNSLPISTSNIQKAVQRVIENVKRTGRRSVLATPIVGSRSHILNNIVENAVKENIVVVTTAGNFHKDACRYSPGSSPHVINVGATKMEDDKDKLYSSFFSGTNFGICVSLYAPGEPESSDYNLVRGTSHACAIVAGAAALVLEKYPHYTPAEVKQYLIDEATNDIINMSVLSLGDKGTNKLLYIGNGPRIERSLQPPSVQKGVIRVKIGSPAYLIHGFNVTIVCNVIIGTPPITIRWLRNGQPDQSRINSSTITVNDANDGDVFTCMAENTYGYDKKDTQIHFAHHFCIAK